MMKVFGRILATMLLAAPLVAQSVDRFERIATFDVDGSVAEIITATPDGRTLIYTDSSENRIGFVDVADARHPRQVAVVATPGEPTSAAVTPDGRWVLVAVDGEPGVLAVVEFGTRTIRRLIETGGQPDSVSVSPDGKFAAVVVENQRDEDLNGGRMPQLPAGHLTVISLAGEPAAWTATQVALTNLGSRFPDDPEPEFVDINSANIAAVTMQENNHIVLVDLANARVSSHFTAGTTTHAADTTRDGNIDFSGSITGARREPDGIVWTTGGRIVTANEGDYTVDLAGQYAGGRDFTIFNVDGSVAFEPGVSLEREGAMAGHYPDTRSGSKGAEFEGVEVGVFGSRQFLFVGSERGDFVGVYRLDSETAPAFVQILPTGDGPEGLLAIPARNLFLTSNEDDGTITIFEGRTGNGPAAYPQIVSTVGGWGALSGLVADHGSILYGVPDSAIRPSRIWTIDANGAGPLRITSEIRLAKNFDLEGIARVNGGWWVVSEGARNAGQTGLTKNLLIRVNENGSIAEEVELPESVNAQQRQFGFEGVAASADGSQIYVAFQREWGDDPAQRVKIGRYTPATREWRFFHYPIEAAPSVTGAWVGLSEITRLEDQTFLVVERDNQRRRNATVKRVYRVSIEGVTPVAAGTAPPLLTKTLVRDLLVEDNWRVEKVESLALMPWGMIIVSDNDGAGETLVVRTNRLRRIWPRGNQ